MNVGLTSTIIQNERIDTKRFDTHRAEDSNSGKYSQLDISDFEASLFSDKTDEHTIFGGLQDQTHNNNYIDPMSDKSFAGFSGDMKDLISSIKDPEMQAVFAEQMTAASQAVSDRLLYQSGNK